MVDPAVAKFAPWLKFEPTASRYAFKYGRPSFSAIVQNLKNKH
jgi:hypothetical protein